MKVAKSQSPQSKPSASESKQEEQLLRKRPKEKTDQFSSLDDFYVKQRQVVEKLEKLVSANDKGRLAFRFIKE